MGSETPEGVLRSRENGVQNNQGARSRMLKWPGSREQKKVIQGAWSIGYAIKAWCFIPQKFFTSLRSASLHKNIPTVHFRTDFNSGSKFTNVEEKIDLGSTKNYFGERQENHSGSREKKVKFQREPGAGDPSPAREFGDFHICVQKKLWGCTVHSNIKLMGVIKLNIYEIKKQKVN